MNKSTKKTTILPEEDEEQWEKVIDFTEIKKDGVDIQDILLRL
ncbi:MAG: hypothetical protein WEC84_00160 [Candidatus Andersenbacteria bacterium]